jgi:hypothetical protein
MATRAPFLKTRYGGYHHRKVPQEDAELTMLAQKRHVANTCAGFGSRCAIPTS